MDNGYHRLKSPLAEQAKRWQEMSQIYAVMVCVALLILFQTLLLNIAIEGFLGGADKVITPAVIGSGVCFCASCWLVLNLLRPRGGSS